MKSLQKELDTLLEQKDLFERNKKLMPDLYRDWKNKVDSLQRQLNPTSDNAFSA